MAEAIVNARQGERWEAFSAGSRPEGYVHPLAIKALQEIGIEHHGRSKSMDEFRGQSFDMVVTLCDQAAEACPVWLGTGKKVHLPFPDPFSAQGSEDERLVAYRDVRDKMYQAILDLLDQ
jgi:arsenate reductase